MLTSGGYCGGQGEEPDGTGMLSSQSREFSTYPDTVFPSVSLQTFADWSQHALVVFDGEPYPSPSESLHRVRRISASFILPSQSLSEVSHIS